MTALLNYYNTGTASVTNGTTGVTGVGTFWGSAIRAGDIFTANGLGVRVASVTDDTHLVLAYNWPGTTLTTATYEIRLPPPSADVTTSIRTLLQTLAGPTFTATTTFPDSATWSASGIAGAAGLTIASSGQIIGSSSALAAAPAFTFNGDPDTGLFHPAANTFSWSAGGSEIGRITSAGLVVGPNTVALTSDWISGNGIQSLNATYGTFSAASSRADAASVRIGSVAFDYVTNLSTYRTIAAIDALTQPSGTANKRGGYLSFRLQPDNTAGSAEYMQLTTLGLGIGMTPSNILDITQNQNATSVFGLLNNNAGVSAGSRVLLSNATNALIVQQNGTGFTTSGVLRQDGGYVRANGAGGLTLTTGASQPIYFGINLVEKMRLDTRGNLGIGIAPNSGWNFGTVVEVNNGNALWSNGVSDLRMSSNVYHDGSIYHFAGTGYGSLYFQSAGAHNWYTTTGSGTAGGTAVFTQAASIDNGGRLTLPLQPSFHVYRSADVAGTSSTYETIPFDTKKYDVGNNFNTSTYKFTAPVAGKYHFDYSVCLKSVSSSVEVDMILFINTTAYYSSLSATIPIGGILQLPGVLEIDMAANDTAYVQCWVGSTHTIGGGAVSIHSWFAGRLVG